MSYAWLLPGAAHADTFVLTPDSLSTTGATDLLNDGSSFSVGILLSDLISAGLLRDGDVIDAISDGTDPVGPTSHDHQFAVSLLSEGAVNTGVWREHCEDSAYTGLACGHSGDQFQWIDNGANDNQIAAPSPWTHGWSGNFGDEALAGLVTDTSIPTPSSCVSFTSRDCTGGDVVNGYDTTTFTWVYGPTTPTPPKLYFSLGKDSPTLAALGVSEGDILQFDGASVTVFRDTSTLGIPSVAELNALTLFVGTETNPAGAEFEYCYAEFSISKVYLDDGPFTTSGGDSISSAATVIEYFEDTSGIGPWDSFIAHTAVSLGLSPEDDVTSLETVTVTVSEDDLIDLPEADPSDITTYFDTGIVATGDAVDNDIRRAFAYVHQGESVAQLLPALVEPGGETRGNAVSAYGDELIELVVIGGAAEDLAGVIQPVLWVGSDPVGAMDLIVLPALGGGQAEVAALDSLDASGLAGVTVGGWAEQINGVKKAVLWDEIVPGVWNLIPLLDLVISPDTESWVNAVLDAPDLCPVIVGAAEDAGGQMRPVIWENDGGWSIVGFPCPDYVLGGEATTVWNRDDGTLLVGGFLEVAPAQQHAIAWKRVDGVWSFWHEPVELISSRILDGYTRPDGSDRFFGSATPAPGMLEAATVWGIRDDTALWAFDLNQAPGAEAVRVLREATCAAIGADGREVIAGRVDVEPGLQPRGFVMIIEPPCLSDPLGPDCNANGVSDDCDIANGSSVDLDGDGIPDECDCPADLDGDGIVGITDFLGVLAAWGPNPGHPADLDDDGIVGITDFLLLLASWGDCSNP